MPCTRQILALQGNFVDLKAYSTGTLHSHTPILGSVKPFFIRGIIETGGFVFLHSNTLFDFFFLYFDAYNI